MSKLLVSKLCCKNMQWVRNIAWVSWKLKSRGTYAQKKVMASFSYEIGGCYTVQTMPFLREGFLPFFKHCTSRCYLYPIFLSNIYSIIWASSPIKKNNFSFKNMPSCGRNGKLKKMSKSGGEIDLVIILLKKMSKTGGEIDLVIILLKTILRNPVFLFNWMKIQKWSNPSFKQFHFFSKSFKVFYK